MLKNNLSLGILDFGFQCWVDVLPKLGVNMLSQLRQVLAKQTEVE